MDPITLYSHMIQGLISSWFPDPSCDYIHVIRKRMTCKSHLSYRNLHFSNKIGEFTEISISFSSSSKKENNKGKFVWRPTQRWFFILYSTVIHVYLSILDWHSCTLYALFILYVYYRHVLSDVVKRLCMNCTNEFLV